MKLKQAVLVLGALAMVVAMASPASAAFILRLDAGACAGCIVEVTDGGVGDLDATVNGVITYSGGLGASNFVVNVTTGISKPVIANSQYSAGIDLNSVNVATSGAGTLIITLADTNFALAGPNGLVTGQVGGTLNAGAGSTINFQSWVNSGNLSPLPGGVIPAGSQRTYQAGGVTFGNGAYSATSNTVLFNPTNNFSLFNRATLTFTGAGQASFNQELEAVVPEPGSMLLLGTGLIGLSGAIRRRFAKKN